MEQQIPLRIGLRDSATFANFYPGNNAGALHLLMQAQEAFVYLWGAEGSGRTHLLQAACYAESESGGQSAYLPLADLGEAALYALEGLEHMSLVCLDDVQALTGHDEQEEALFHLYNRIRESGGRLLVAANASPAGLAPRLPDLRSRLLWGPVFHLHRLDDAGRLAALQLRADRRGFQLNNDVGTYLLHRHPRDMAKLFELLEQLDHASLTAQRRLTIPFVRSLLQTLKH